MILRLKNGRFFFSSLSFDLDYAHITELKRQLRRMNFSNRINGMLDSIHQMISFLLSVDIIEIWNRMWLKTRFIENTCKNTALTLTCLSVEHFRFFFLFFRVELCLFCDFCHVSTIFRKATLLHLLSDCHTLNKLVVVSIDFLYLCKE